MIKLINEMYKPKDNRKDYQTMWKGFSEYAYAIYVYRVTKTSSKEQNL